MTEHATPTVTHDDGVQSQGLSQLLARRIPAGLGAVLVTLLAIASFLVWVWSLVVTWISHIEWGLPFFQVTVAALLVVGVAFYAYKTLAWLLPLIVSAFWIWVSVVPFQPIFQVLFQTITVTALIAAAVFAVQAAAEAEKARF
ncbi:hypothetical protein [Gryllotalpicola sp.]|uniref:hypothetical protein n=1 Tax=Gryllotalpicola sp. TaxID=1932787 RepID=UPI00262922D5|nr:hypothetical protein [Gryllotalpicola sp.]